MIVVDASFVVEVLQASPEREGLVERLATAPVQLSVPHLLDVEVASALRGLVRCRALDSVRAAQALEDFEALPLARHAHLEFLPRVFELSTDFSACDAVYVALAEALGATLWTCDAKLAARAAAFIEVELS